jgi:hypothetical protein
LAFALLAGAHTARAEPPTRAELIQMAQQAKTSGNHDEALRLARSAGEQKMTASLRRFLVEEESALGQWIDAYADAQACTREAAAEPPSPNHDAVLIGCRALLHELREHVGIVVFDFSSPPPADARVTVDGRLVESLLTESEHPTALGDVVVEVTAPGRVAVRRNAHTRAEPTHVALELGPPPPEPAPVAAPSPAVPAVDTVPMRTVRGPSGIVVAGVGVAAGIGALVTRAVANGKYDTLRERCASQGCPDGSNERDRIDQLDTISLVSGIAGGALVGLGATLYFVIDRHREPVTPGAASTSFALSGSF